MLCGPAYPAHPEAVVLALWNPRKLHASVVLPPACSFIALGLGSLEI